MPNKLFLYNTYSKKKEEFIPQDPNHVRIYDCGPTVYMYAHIGNLYRYFMSDLFRRVLVYFGYIPYQVMNVTDVGHLTQDDIDEGEDKVMKQAKQEGLTPQQIASKYLEAFLNDLDRVKILRPHKMPKATEHIEDMIEMIKQLEERGYTYKIDDGIYFDVSKFPTYGRLSGNTLDDLMAGARVEVNPAKRHPADFALWKRVGKDHLMKWDSPWGTGCPGWHIECSAMARKYLGLTLDLHSGGEDNIFPHHESEIAQSECANDGVQFSRFWMHCRYFLVDGKKMAKRSGTKYTLQDLINQGYSPIAFRFLSMSSYYRKQLNFTFGALKGAQAGIDRLNECVSALQKVGKVKGEKIKKIGVLVDKAREDFKKTLSDDLNTPEALAVVFGLVKELNKRISAGEIGNKSAKLALDFLLDEVDSIFDTIDRAALLEKELGSEIERLIKERDKARADRDWKLADRLREKLHGLGMDVRDKSA